MHLKRHPSRPGTDAMMASAVLLLIGLGQPALAQSADPAEAAALNPAANTPAQESQEDAMASDNTTPLGEQDKTPAPAEMAQVDASPSPEPKPCPEPSPCPQFPAPTTLDQAQLSTVQMLSGVVATALALPATLALATAIGTGPSDLYVAALPALLVLAVLPPLATTGAEWGLSKWLLGASPGSFWWSLGAASLGHVGAIGGAVALKVSTQDLSSATVFAASESLLLPSLVTATLALTRPSENLE